MSPYLKHDDVVKKAVTAMRAGRISGCGCHHRNGNEMPQSFIIRPSYIAVNRLFGWEERPDIFFMWQGLSVVFEAKTSIQDLRADFKKSFRANPEKGVGDYRFYLYQQGVLNVDLPLPKGWGVAELYFECKKPCISFVKQSDKFNANKHSECDHLRIRLNEVQRAMQIATRGY